MIDILKKKTKLENWEERSNSMDEKKLKQQKKSTDEKSNNNNNGSNSSSSGKGKDDYVAGTNFKYGQVVYGRMSGYPLWPARVHDPSRSISSAVRKAQPKNSPVILLHFFSTNDYAWLPPESVSDFLTEPNMKKKTKK